MSSCIQRGRSYQVLEPFNQSSQQERLFVVDIAIKRRKLRNTEKFYKVPDNELAVHGQRQRSRCRDKDGYQRSKRSVLSLTVGCLECATTPETSEKLIETVCITCERLGRCSKFDIAAIKWRPCEREDKRSSSGSREDAGHSPSSTLIALHRLMSVSR